MERLTLRNALSPTVLALGPRLEATGSLASRLPNVRHADRDWGRRSWGGSQTTSCFFKSFARLARMLRLVEGDAWRVSEGAQRRDMPSGAGYARAALLCRG